MRNVYGLGRWHPANVSRLFPLQSDVSAVVELLEQFALDTITCDSTHGSRGQQLTTLTLICKTDDRDEVAAALLQVYRAWLGQVPCTSLLMRTARLTCARSGVLGSGSSLHARDVCLL